MNQSDMIACYLNKNETVVAVDTWNPSSDYNLNEIDASQDDVCLYESCTYDGRILCQ